MSRKETFQAILDRWYLYWGFDGNWPKAPILTKMGHLP
jgi:hypothetical protein